ncbi:MAG TPA: hypothetical protein VNA22_02505 [Pyrinomonadaceae bacterium]|nr:hypothetical protein [Pyrinomonadaceae bacterium]
MANKIFLLATLLFLALGCGISDRVQRAVSNEPAANAVVANVNANKTLTDKAVDTAVGEKKVGIQECDEAMDMLEAQANNPDDNFVIKAGKKTLLNTFREQLKQSLENNKADTTEVAKFCKEFRDNMIGSMNESNSNSKNSF